MLTFVAIGIAAGVLSGLFGIGGGILIVPALVHFAGFPMKQAIGSSLAVFLLPVGILGALTYWKAGHINPQASLLVAFGLFFGAWGGSRIAMATATPVLQRLFAVFLVLVAVRMWIKA
jgi:uncharacterized membrane protein YfcA